ncbi:hypothetical protein HK101_012045 [Irineochytrium annulatum]|nr:hypothetical protein HK101_012045 [Irineochytrium annulatum]
MKQALFNVIDGAAKVLGVDLNELVLEDLLLENGGGRVGDATQVEEGAKDAEDDGTEAEDGNVGKSGKAGKNGKAKDGKCVVAQKRKEPVAYSESENDQDRESDDSESGFGEPMRSVGNEGDKPVTKKKRTA